MHKRGCLQRLKKHGVAAFMQTHVRLDEFDSFRHVKEYLRWMVLDVWQCRWESSELGRVTFAFFPLVPDLPRLDFTWRSTQVLTGHGNFRSHLFRIGKMDEDICRMCDLDESDNPEHRLLRCLAFSTQRDVLSDACGFPFKPGAQ